MSHILSIMFYLLIALDAQMSIHKGYGSRSKDKAQGACGPGPGGPCSSGLGCWSRAHIHYGELNEECNQYAIYNK